MRVCVPTRSGGQDLSGGGSKRSAIWCAAKGSTVRIAAQRRLHVAVLDRPAGARIRGDNTQCRRYAAALYIVLLTIRNAATMLWLFHNPADHCHAVDLLHAVQRSRFSVPGVLAAAALAQSQSPDVVKTLDHFPWKTSHLLNSVQRADVVQRVQRRRQPTVQAEHLRNWIQNW